MSAVACLACGWVHVAGDVVPAGSRFGPASGYMPKSGGPVRATREEVQADLCATRRAAVAAS